MRLRLFVLIGLVLAPLIGFSVLDLVNLRTERLEEAKSRALQLARESADVQRNLVARASAILEIAVQVPAILRGDVDECRDLLRAVKGRNEWADGFGLIDLGGRPVCSNDPGFRDTDLSDREYFKQALATDRVYVSSFLVSRTSGRSNVVLARAVRDASGKATGVLIGTIDLGWLRRLGGEVANLEGGSMLLLDRTGVVLTRHPDDRGWIGRDLSQVPAIGELMRLGNGTWDLMGSDGMPRVGAVVSIPESGEKLIVAFQKLTILAGANAELGRSLWRLAALVGTAAVLAWLGGELLFLRWIRRLKLGADRLGHGQFSVRCGVPRSAGELAVVGQALEQAGHSLEEREGALRRAEMSAQDANRRFELAEQIARIGHWRLDLPSRALTWSQGVYVMHGLDPATFQPTVEAAIEAYHPEDRAEVARCVSEAVNQRRPFRFELRVVRSDGTVRDVVCRGLCDVAADEGLTAVFGTIMDVTDLRRAENAAAEKTALLGVTLDNMDQGLMMVGPDRRIEICNARAQAMLDLPGELMASRPTTEAILDLQWANGEFDGAPESVRALMRAGGFLQERRPQLYERTRPNGTTLEVRTTPLPTGGIVRTYTDISHRKRAEAAVQASEARYRLLAENTTDMIVLTALDLRRTFISPASRDLYGCEPEELLDQSPLETIHADDHEAVREAFAALARGGDRALTVHRIRRLDDGSWRWVEAAYKRLLAPATGEHMGYLVAVRDVTKRHEAEEAARASDARFRRLAETTSDVVTHLSLPGFERTYASPTCRKLFGCEPSELLGRRPSASNIHPDDAPGVRARAERLSRNEADHDQVTYRAQHKDGHWIWVEASLNLMLDEDGQPSAIVCSLRDVSERKAAEAALAESETRYRLLADNASDIIMLIAPGPSGGPSYVSPAVRTMLGYEPDEFLGIPSTDLIHPDEVDRVMSLHGGIGPESPQATSVHRLRHKEGHWVWVEIVFTFTHLQGGEPRILAAIRDVSERQRQAASLEQARTAAEAGARVKSEFLANMSHELRTPLTGMLGVHDLLGADPALTDQQRRYVGLAQQTGRSLLTIVNDILDFSKIEAGQMVIEQVPLSLRELIESCRQLGAEGVKVKGVTVAAEVASSAPDLLYGDPTRLRQVLLNLVTNAVKFTREGEVRIGARWDRGRLSVSVRDTGIGIAPESLPTLFERFSQGDNSTARQYGGTGLGLAICRRLVELMGGSIGVESRPGHGSTFTFELPLPEAREERRSFGRNGAGDTGRLAGRRILLAEDNLINQEIIRTVLERQGHDVTLVADGNAAVAACREREFDIVLMDVQMPGMDGLAATAAIRSWEATDRRPPVPIVALTANAMAEEVRSCRVAGADAHVAKPIDWAHLFSTMDRLCSAPTRMRA